MPDRLGVDTDGLRSSAASNDALAGILTATAEAPGVSSATPTGVAAQVVHAALAGIRTDRGRYLDGRAGALRSGANSYDDTDDGNARSVAKAM